MLQTPTSVRVLSSIKRNPTKPPRIERRPIWVSPNCDLSRILYVAVEERCKIWVVNPSSTVESLRRRQGCMIRSTAPPQEGHAQNAQALLRHDHPQLR
jgi:hypothetical protein